LQTIGQTWDEPAYYMIRENKLMYHTRVSEDKNAIDEDFMTVCTYDIPYKCEFNNLLFQTDSCDLSKKLWKL